MNEDEEIKKQLVDRFYWDDRIDASNIKVRVDRGEVLLEGTVPSFVGKDAAYNSTFLVPGIVSVKNELKVEHPEKTIIPDEQLESDARATLIFDADVDSSKVDVNVRGGEALLEGSVNSFWKKFYTEDMICKIRGIKSIDNRLAVVPTGRFSDEQISREITSAVRRNYHADAPDIDVKVEKGKVFLAGKVPSLAAKRDIYEAAFYTPGVVDIRDSGIIIELGGKGIAQEHPEIFGQ